MEQTLLLNASYEPLKVVHWQKAITLWCQGKVEVIAVHDREIRAVSISFKIPSVCATRRRAGAITYTGTSSWTNPDKFHHATPRRRRRPRHSPRLRVLERRSVPRRHHWRHTRARVVPFARTAHRHSAGRPRRR